MKASTIRWVFLLALVLGGAISRAEADNRDAGREDMRREILRDVMVWQAVLCGAVIAIAIFAFGKAYEAKRSEAATYIREEGAASIAALRRDYDTLLAESKGKASDVTAEVTAIAYEGARAYIQGLHTCMDAAVGETVPARTREALKRIEVAGAQLQVRFGDNTDVIAGVNKLYELCSPSVARSAFQVGLARPEVSDETKDIIHDRVRDLQSRNADS